MAYGSVNVPGASEVELTAHKNDKNNPHQVTAAQAGAIPTTEKGAANGVATLDANSKIPLNQIPALQSKYLSIEGGDMVGDIVMHDFTIVGLPTPTVDDEAATKGYVDQAVAASGGNEWDDMGKVQLGETGGYICFKRKIIGNGGNADGNSTIIYEYMIHSDYHDLVIYRNPAMETGIEFDYFKGVEYITPPGNETVFNRYNLSGCAGYNFPIFYKTPLITTFNRFSFTNCNLQLANNLTNTLALNYDLYWLAGTVVSADMDVVIPAGTILSRWLVEATND